MANQIIRTFHPIGQGAFYSERIDSFNMVYDCGVKPQAQEKVVSQSFSREEVIDILVISHFDEDHINLIPTLKKTVKAIKTVIYPLMSPVQKAYILSTYTDKELYDIVLTPEKYFKEAKIIWIKPALNNGNEINLNDNLVFIEQLQDKEIDSGVKLGHKGASEWVFIPYNYELEGRSKELEEKLKKHKIEISAENLISQISKKKIARQINAIYKSISDGSNGNSLLLYSGPTSRGLYHITGIYHPEFHNWWPFFWSEISLAGCIYTGDISINKAILNWIYSIKQHYDVGTIQIPHHGAVTSFNDDLLLKGPYYCPISFGTTNNYGHPSSKVLGSILRNASLAISVTEAQSSIFIEHIVK